MTADGESLLVQDIADDEYSENFFQFTANDVYCGVKRTIIPEAIAESTERLKKCLLQNCKGYENQIESACAELLKKSLSSIPLISAPLKDLTDLNFKIPKDVLLDQDLIQSVQYSEEDVKKIDLELAALEKRTSKACLVEGYLQQELDMLTHFDKMMDITESINATSELATSSLDDASILKSLKLAKHITRAEEERDKLIALPAEMGLQAAEKKVHSKIFTKPVE